MTHYRIVQNINGTWVQSETTDLMAWAMVRDVEFTGTNLNRRQRAELQDQPIMKGFLGPMWDGDAIRYEDRRANDILSV